ncbi:MAG: Mu-like prophage major head subunit gpT family protein [Chloroflexi bacterium]|nr:Mu-like prophage major head subunit gpT family protein [Chloroflexota bacterium]
MEMLQLLENIKAEEASVQKLFGDEGQGVRHNGRKSPQYMAKLTEAAQLVAGVISGRRPAYHLREALSTSDFPNLFGDILDRQLLAAYQDWPQTFRNYTHVAQVADFRTVKRFKVYGADAVLPPVGQQEQYKSDQFQEASPYTYAVSKYGRVIPLAWETLLNDDLGAFSDIPTRFGRAARRSEEKFATQLFVDANGPHASVYTVGNKNKVNATNAGASFTATNPPLSIPALQEAMAVLANQIDEQGEPITIESLELVVPPSLEITALNILNGVQLWQDTNNNAGTPDTRLITTNWMKGRVNMNVNPYIPIVASTANGGTSWFLFANPHNGRPALEVGFLRGHETPEVFMKSPNIVNIGAQVDPMNGDFDTDSIQYKVRHVFGGTVIDPKMTVASNGTGA